ncbi:hypothetical protein GOODEAATRI_000310 [Goodea atripinnis]|uniref:Secreted protein n=1 Tax=Goodea atripinnis TaxID=208336 RepID=A0ABV0N6N4_9TELE
MQIRCSFIAVLIQTKQGGKHLSVVLWCPLLVDAFPDCQNKSWNLRRPRNKSSTTQTMFASVFPPVIWTFLGPGKVFFISRCPDVLKVSQSFYSGSAQSRTNM